MRNERAETLPLLRGKGGGRRVSEKVTAVHDKTAREIRFTCGCGNVVYIDNPDPFELLSLYQGSMRATCGMCWRMSGLELGKVVDE